MIKRLMTFRGNYRNIFRRKRLLVLLLSFFALFLIYHTIAILFINLSLTQSEREKIKSREEELIKFYLTSKKEKEKLSKLEQNDLNKIKYDYKHIENDSKKKKSMEIKQTVFKCLNSLQEISFDFYNDDYCDCDDGSDEPYTNACLNSQFFCSVKAFNNNRSIPSSMVNDGICDCCDGSDEWLNLTVHLHENYIQIQQIEKVYLSPCINRC